MEGGEEVGRPLGLTIPTHVPLHLYAITWKCLPTSHLIDRELSTQVRAWANENPLLGEVKSLPGIKDVEVTAPRLGYVFPEFFDSDLHLKAMLHHLLSGPNPRTKNAQGWRPKSWAKFRPLIGILSQKMSQVAQFGPTLYNIC